MSALVADDLRVNSVRFLVRALVFSLFLFFFLSPRKNVATALKHNKYSH